jgi:hypothetical protein
MKLFASLLLTLVALTACSAVPFSPQDKKTITAIMPVVPVVPAAVQKQAAVEMKAGQCPSENKIINACLSVVDQARISK